MRKSTEDVRDEEAAKLAEVLCSDSSANKPLGNDYGACLTPIPPPSPGGGGAGRAGQGRGAGAVYDHPEQRPHHRAPAGPAPEAGLPAGRAAARGGRAHAQRPGGHAPARGPPPQRPLLRQGAHRPRRQHVGGDLAEEGHDAAAPDGDVRPAARRAAAAGGEGRRQRPGPRGPDALPPGRHLRQHHHHRLPHPPRAVRRQRRGCFRPHGPDAGHPEQQPGAGPPAGGRAPRGHRAPRQRRHVQPAPGRVPRPAGGGPRHAAPQHRQHQRQGAAHGAHPAPLRLRPHLQQRRGRQLHLSAGEGRGGGGGGGERGPGVAHPQRRDERQRGRRRRRRRRLRRGRGGGRQQPGPGHRVRRERRAGGERAPRDDPVRKLEPPGLGPG